MAQILNHLTSTAPLPKEKAKWPFHTSLQKDQKVVFREKLFSVLLRYYCSEQHGVINADVKQMTSCNKNSILSIKQQLLNNFVFVESQQC